MTPALLDEDRRTYDPNRGVVRAGEREVTTMTLELIDPDGLHQRPEYLPALAEARLAVFGVHRPADTVLGVEALAEPGYLVEVGAIAVVD